MLIAGLSFGSSKNATVVSRRSPTTNFEYHQWHQLLGNKDLTDASLSRLRYQCQTIRINGPLRSFRRTRNLHRLQIGIRSRVSENSRHRDNLTFVVKCVSYDV